MKTPPDLSCDEQTRILETLISPERLERIDKVLAQRTRHLTLVLENIHQPHNASACLRSAEIFGIQDVHILESSTRFRHSKGITMGSDKWLTLHRYREQDRPIKTCFEQLKTKGYRVLATTLRPDALPVRDVPLDQPLALLLGGERHGLSDTAHDLADGFVQIPMQGFTQSFNLSVSAALCLYELTNRLRATDRPWQLSEQEKRELRLLWLHRSVRHPEQILAHAAREMNR